MQKGEGGVASLVRQTAGSVNCAFLRLGQIVGIDKVIEQAQKMGVTSPAENVVSFPLGVNEISPLEMAGAYAAIANDGVYNAPYFVDKITDAAGNVIYEHEAKPAAGDVVAVRPPRDRRAAGGRHRRHRHAGAAPRPPGRRARPARPTSTATRGSSASPRSWRRPSGWATRSRWCR